MRFESSLDLEQLKGRAMQLSYYLEDNEAKARKRLEKAQEIALDIRTTVKHSHSIFRCIKINRLWRELDEYRGAYHYYMASADRHRSNLTIYRKLIDDKVGEAR